MNVRAVLFDLDGTLVDSLADIGESMNAALSELGFATYPLADYRRFVGDGMTMLARRCLPVDAQDEKAVAQCVARLRAIYTGRASSKTRPYAGIPELLDALEAGSRQLAVLSNKPHELTVKVVEQLLPRWKFAAVFGERTGIPRKPDPAGALEIAAMLGLPPQAFLYVGDTPTDLVTARAAGMRGLGAAWGFRSESELLEAGAPAILRSPADLLSHLD